MANPDQHLSPYDVERRIEDTLGARVLGVVASENIPDVLRDYETLEAAHQMAINQIGNLQHALHNQQQIHQTRRHRDTGIINQLRNELEDSVITPARITPTVYWVLNARAPPVPTVHEVWKHGVLALETITVVQPHDPLHRLKSNFFDLIKQMMTNVTDGEMINETDQYGAWSTQEHPQYQGRGHPLERTELLNFLMLEMRAFTNTHHEFWCAMKSELISRTFFNQVRACYNDDRVDMTQNNCARSKLFILDFFNNNLGVMLAF